MSHSRIRLQETGTELDFVRLGPENTAQYFVSPRNYKILSDVWMDVKTAGKKTNFQHEKHEELLERIIRWSTSGGDWVLDSFAGSMSWAAGVGFIVSGLAVPHGKRGVLVVGPPPLGRRMMDHFAPFSVLRAPSPV